MKLTVARSWREFGKQQAVAVYNLYEVLGDHEIDLHLCINRSINLDYIEKFKNKIPHWNFKIYKTDSLDLYSIKKGASESKILEFKKWPWIYHIILYYFLWNEKGVDYLLTYDDDIFFKKEKFDYLDLLEKKIPFSIEDQSFSDKSLMPQLIKIFGDSIHDDYYSCSHRQIGSNSGFMGILNKEIFTPFESPENFCKLLDLFEYKRYIHTYEELDWEIFKILLQEQSFLGILNRSFSDKRHVVLTKDDGYFITDKIEDMEKTEIQHYIAMKKYSRNFLNRINQKHNEVLRFLD
jgi:hypothetical protein